MVIAKFAFALALRIFTVTNSNRKMRVLQNFMPTTVVIPLKKQLFPQYYHNYCPHYRGITAVVVSITCIAVNPRLPRYYPRPHYHAGLYCAAVHIYY